MQRRQVLEEHLVPGILGRVEVDLAHLEQREVTLAVFRRTNQTRDRVAGSEIESTDLGGADVDVIGSGEIRTVGRAQEAETVLQNLEHAIAVDIFALARMRLEQTENDVLLARTGHALDTECTRHFDQLGDGHRLERGQVHRIARGGELRAADNFSVLTRLDEGRVIHRCIVVDRTTDIAVAHAATAIRIAMTAVTGSFPLTSRPALAA